MTAALVVFVALSALCCWAAGYALAMEDWVGGTRQRFENWVYRRPDAVRYGTAPSPIDDPSDLLWDRAQYWAPSRKPTDGRGRWLWRGQCGYDLAAAGRRVPTRLAQPGVLRYAVPTLDGVPLNRRDRLATVLRTKVADLWGCPKCSGWWGGAAVAGLMFAKGGWPFGWEVAAVGYVAGWGLARRIGWSKE